EGALVRFEPGWPVAQKSRSSKYSSIRRTDCSPSSRVRRAVGSEDPTPRTSDKPALTLVEGNLRVRAVAERLVLRLPASAQCDAVADLERLPVRHRDRNAARHPVRAVLRHRNGLRQIGLDRDAVD